MDIGEKEEEGEGGGGKDAHIYDYWSMLKRYIYILGRIFSKRESGGKLIFYDLHGEGTRVQILANARFHKGREAFGDVHERIKRGDIIGVRGHPAKSKSGELSVIPIEVSECTI